MNEDPKILFLRQPDAFESSVRLACGALLGLVIGLWAWLRWELPWMAGAGLTVVLVLACAIWARKYGDDFWLAVLHASRF